MVMVSVALWISRARVLVAVFTPIDNGPAASAIVRLERLTLIEPQVWGMRRTVNEKRHLPKEPPSPK